MGKLKKKGTTGAAKNYITRTQAVRKLQVSLQDFRRLCIFKGIYPREPRNKKKASKSSTPSTTFYYTKDIQYLLHEPLLAKFREHKALAKKIGRALGRGEAGDAKRLDAGRSRMTLDHIVKERYPTFVDALRDLDDALSMLFLFATLPATSHIPPKTIALCQRLCLEFEHYLIVSNSLRKSFLSIKGIYYQATIMGQDILWLAPYKFVQNMVGDIDFRIMGTFVEFYTTLLGFVNYRLYTTVGLVYPPKFDKTSDELGGELGAFKIEGKSVGTSQDAIANGETLPDAPSEEAKEKAQATADKLASTATQDIETQDAGTEDAAEVAGAEKIDEFQVSADAEADVLPQAAISSDVASTLFAPFTFFLGRETPRAPLELLVRAFGCKRVGWDAVLGAGAFTNDEKDPRITHQVVDRPQIPALAAADDEEESSTRRMRIAGRTYVQPQWVWDCINQGKLLRPDLYAPGATLPPHISPWVKPKKGEYDPTLSLAEQEEENEAELDEGSEVEEDKNADEDEQDIVKGGPVSVPKTIVADISDDEDEVAPGEGMDIADDDSEEESDEDEEADAAFGGFTDDEEAESADEEETAALAYQRELEAEARGQAFNTSAAGRTPAKSLTDKRKKVEKQKREEAEDIERRKMMLPNRKRKLFDKMQYSNKVKDDAAKKLRSKRRKLERTAV